MSHTHRLAAANTARQARYLQRKVAHGFQFGRRGNSPVRRHSQYAGEHEAREWRRNNVFSATERRARKQAITEWNYREKKAGEHWGPLGPSGERFLDSMMGLRCFRTGRLDLSIKAIAAKLVMCVDTVNSYVKRLEAHGLLVKLRRSRPVEDPEPGGPRVEQITNAYWFKLPAELAERVRQILAKGGKPVDQEERERADAALVKAMVDGLPLAELVDHHQLADGRLAAILKRLAAGVEQQE